MLLHLDGTVKKEQILYNVSGVYFLLLSHRFTSKTYFDMNDESWLRGKQPWFDSRCKG